MRVLFLIPPPVEGINVVREGSCMQRTGAWTSVRAPVSLATTTAGPRALDFEVKPAGGSVEDMNLEEIIAMGRGLKPGDVGYFAHLLKDFLN